MARDLTAGVPLSELPDGRLLEGKAGEDDVLLIRRGEECFAVSALCSHYHAPLAQGLLVGETIRCPLHHACFSIRTGRLLRAPAFDDLTCWRVERRGDTVYVREKLSPFSARTAPLGPVPKSVLIVGGGAAGLAAADTLRREGYTGPVTLISADQDPPYDRPNLSKDFLAGTAPDEWMPLRTPDYYREQRIELILGAEVVRIDSGQSSVTTRDGRQFAYGALLLATGADPVRLDIPGASAGQVFYLRSFADCRAIIARAATARSAVVVGSSFIGLEVAASLRARGLEVHVVAMDQVPMERVLGAEVGRFVQSLHEAHGVTFHFATSVASINAGKVMLANGSTLEADFLVLGVGVRPSLLLASAAGISVEKGVSVDEFLQTNVPGIYAAGDIARWPDPHTGERIRVEHWVVGERQGQVAARNILGAREKFQAVPFFWSQHYDVTIGYVGHAERWDSTAIDGSLAARDCAVSYRRGERILAVATISRDLDNLRIERDMESLRSPDS